MNYEYQIDELPFKKDIINDWKLQSFDTENWPVVYIIHNPVDSKNNSIYIGETTDFISRMDSHLKHNEKKLLSGLKVISSKKFNKSAALDIEANLIKYFSGEGIYKILNGNMGIANHSYYQKKEAYWPLFRKIWDELRNKGVAKNSLEDINNSDLFKYSPYKTLSRDQRKSIVEIVDVLLHGKFDSILVEGGAGTGKTVLAIYIIKMLVSEIEDFNFKEFETEDSSIAQMVSEFRRRKLKPSIALVIPMQSFRTTIKRLFKHIKGLHPNMVIGPADLVKKKGKYDLVIVDEGHRLRQRKNLSSYFASFDKVNAALRLNKEKGNELNWVKLKSEKNIIFYDYNQSIKPSDVNAGDFEILKSDIKTKCLQLKSQFRINAGNNYVKFLDELFLNKLPSEIHRFKDYELKLFNSIHDFKEAITQRNREFGLSRMIAGYSWEWKSKKNKSLFDIEIEGLKLKWNSTGIDWINTPESINEIGCIHTSQGYDLNYAGVIFGNEITYSEKDNQIKVLKENYYDRNGKNSISDDETLKRYIINIYKTMMLRGIKGTYLYVCDPKLKEHFKRFIQMV